MKKIYITGISGMGKSTIAKELDKKGITAFDIDEVRGLCHWQNKESLGKVDYHSGASVKWLEAHEWIFDKEKLRNLIEGNELVVVVGMPANYDELLLLFERIFLLQCGQEIFLNRLNIRTGKDEFGKTTDEKKYILDFYKDFEKDLIEKGVIPTNAENPIEVVVEEIISKI